MKMKASHGRCRQVGDMIESESGDWRLQYDASKETYELSSSDGVELTGNLEDLLCLATCVVAIVRPELLMERETGRGENN